VRLRYGGADRNARNFYIRRTLCALPGKAHAIAAPECSALALMIHFSGSRLPLQPSSRVASMGFLFQREIMKTIPLTESAHQRLIAWKQNGTFSDIIEKLVPARGSIAAALFAADSLPEIPDKEFANIEQSIKRTRTAIPCSLCQK
jgi:predicted CopG family antitoxin